METIREGKYANNSLAVAKTKDLRVIPIHIHFLSFASCRNIGENNEVGSKRGLSAQNKMQASRIQANDSTQFYIFVQLVMNFALRGKTYGVCRLSLSPIVDLLSLSLSLLILIQIQIYHIHREIDTVHTHSLYLIYTLIC